ncbi:MAG: DUF2339 domain-containing protein [Pyrinomonadaceae bacterium]
MTENQQQIERLQTRLDRLVRTQIDFQREVSQIRSELERLRGAKEEIPITQRLPPPPPRTEPQRPSAYEPPFQPRTDPHPPAFEPAENKQGSFSAKADNIAGSARGDFEKFIGENLLSKIGIVILIIGVAIGAKFAIDQGWISPLVRIVFGYACGLVLFGFAVKLRAKYETFSSVLISGSLSILYFVTYFAYALYQIFGQLTAFGLMFLITAVTVAAALKYSKQIIAHLGLVGAYATPFLLSDNSGNYRVLFTYVAIINVGILAVCLTRYWKPLFYSSFIVTWLIFGGWFVDRYADATHFSLALTFATIYFLIFYFAFVGYKFRSGENVAVENVGLTLANSSIYYALGYALLDGHAGWGGYLGLFTVANAAIHMVFAIAAHRIKNVSTDFVYLLGALVLTFVTIAIPVQFDGQAVTLVWTAEALFLFVIGRTKPIELYEHFSYPLMFVASASLLYDFGSGYAERQKVLAEAANFPFFSGFFITSLFYVAAFAGIYFVNRSKDHFPAISEDIRVILRYALAFAGGLVLYNAFRFQIHEYFDFLQYKTALSLTIKEYGVVTGGVNADLTTFNVLWQINYTLLFVTILALSNLRWFRSVSLAIVNLFLNVLTISVFVFVGLYLLGDLRGSYLRTDPTAPFQPGSMHLAIRYFSYAFVAGTFVSIYSYSRSALTEFLSLDHRKLAFEMLLTAALLLICTSELLTWMDIYGLKDSFKLGLSIFWGIYALALVGLGIYFGKRHLRISAIVLFAITLIKLFFYDIAELDTVSKTAVFVSLGGLMLVVSFLYHKYKALIFKA